MSNQEEHTRDPAGKATRAAGEFVEQGSERVREFVAAQSEFLDRLQDINRRWADRMRAEAEMGAEMATQLTSSRSFSETASAFQNWTSRHLEMATEDTRRLVSDAQQIMETGARFWTGGGHGKSYAGVRSLMS